MTIGQKVFWIDVAAFVPAFALAVYLGANAPISISCGFMAVSVVNLIGASVNLRRS